MFCGGNLDLEALAFLQLSLWKLIKTYVQKITSVSLSGSDYFES